MKIYTKTGDSGSTSLLGGVRVSKADQKIEAYGTVDELNSFIGLLRAHCPESDRFHRNIQNKLFNIGSILASGRKTKLSLPELKDADIEDLEQEIDRLQTQLPELKNFILPGGSEANASAHICRCICRRAERRVVALESGHLLIIKYLNRLSDYLFVLSRYLLHRDGLSETAWEKD